MRLPVAMIMNALKRGGCIRTFYRRSRNQSAKCPPLPEGFVLETPGESEGTILNHLDFYVFEKQLVCAESWSQIVGGTEFGGARWILRQPRESAPYPESE